MPDVRSRSVLTRRAVSLGLAVVPFGVAFGVAARQAGLSVAEAAGFSVFVFAGSSQIAAVSVLADGGSALAAVATGLLLNLRSLAFGLIMAPALHRSLPRRALESQLMIDEAMAVGTSVDDIALRRHGYIAGGLAVFVTWNLATLAGATVVPPTGTLVESFGLDATIPAAFLALLWPRLAGGEQRRVAVLGALSALALVPIAPPGVPVVIAGLAVLAAKRARP